MPMNQRCTQGSTVAETEFPLRSVNFRLSDRDYARLRDICERRGIRSVSGFLRTLVKWVIDSGEKDLVQLLGLSGRTDSAERPAADWSESQVASFQVRMDSMAREIGTLSETLRSRRAGETSTDSGICDAAAD